MRIMQKPKPFSEKFMKKLQGSLFVIVCFLVVGCSSNSAYMDSQTREAHTVSEKLDAYKLKPLDPLYIRFNGVLDQQFLEPVIDENGDINLLHINDPVRAAGLTTSELEDKIEQLYINGGIYRTISVNVTMTAKVYYVQGEVLQPGQFSLSSGTTLLQAIAGARGYTSFANRKKVTISRQGKIYTYNLVALEKDPSQDIKIEAGDVIKVWQSRF